MSAPPPLLAIDYGAVFTRAALVWPGGQARPLTFDGGSQLSSAVHAAGQVMVVGEAAWQRAQSDPDGFIASPLRAGAGTVTAAGREVPVGELVCATLRHVAAHAVELAGGPVEDVRMVVPAGWGPRRRTWLRQAAHRAGLGQPRLIEAPVAAAAHLVAGGLQLPVGSFLLVCDVGAGGEATVLRRGPTGFEVLSTLADPAAGGARVDELLTAALPAPTPAPTPQAAVPATPVPATPVGSAPDAPGTAAPAAAALTAAAPGAAPGAEDSVTRWGAARWAVAASVRTAKEALSAHPAVTVPLPGQVVVLNAAQMQQVAAPVIKRVAQLAAEAVSNAELSAPQLSGVYCTGGAAVMPGIAAAVAEQIGHAPQVLPEPGLAAVLGAADAPATAVGVGASPGASPVAAAFPGSEVFTTWAGVGGASDGGTGEVPPLRRLFGVAVPGLASLVLFAHFTMSATFSNGTPGWRRPGYYVLATWAELAVAAVLATAACVSAGSFFAALMQHARHHPTAPAPATRTAGGIAAAATAAAGIAGLYAVTAAAYFGVPLGGPLRWALLPVLPALSGAALAAWLARRGTTPRTGWDATLAFPLTSAAAAAVGMTLTTASWQGTVPAIAAGWSDAAGHLGGLLLGVGIACALTRILLLRLALAVPLGLFGLIMSGANSGVLAVAYALAVGVWWGLRLWPLLRAPAPAGNYAR